MNFIEEALDNIKLILSSPRERAPGTIRSYLQTGKTFLQWRGSMFPPNEKDFRRYFIYRRGKSVSERTLTKEFVQLQKLASANEWPWPFTKDDRPLSDKEPFAPALTLEEVETLISARDLFNDGELFYVALSTTWGLRREEMVRIRKRDYNEETIKIRTAKRGPKIEHLIPEEICKALSDFNPHINNINTLSYIFYRVMDKSGLGQRKGYGWHSIRRTLRTALEWKLAENRKPLSLVADYMAWSKAHKGVVYGGAAMLGVYSHQEVMSDQPFAVDRIILPIHPFLGHWRQAALPLF